MLRREGVHWAYPSPDTLKACRPWLARKRPSMAVYGPVRGRPSPRPHISAGIRLASAEARKSRIAPPERAECLVGFRDRLRPWMAAVERDMDVKLLACPGNLPGTARASPGSSTPEFHTASACLKSARSREWQTGCMLCAPERSPPAVLVSCFQLRRHSRGQTGPCHR